MQKSRLKKPKINKIEPMYNKCMLDFIKNE